MAAIDIHHAHSLPAAEAREAVQQVADRLSERFGMDCAWHGDRLDFSRAGVDGCITVAPDELHLTARLGFMLSPMRGKIEAEIRRVLAEKFA